MRRYPTSNQENEEEGTLRVARAFLFIKNTKYAQGAANRDQSIESRDYASVSVMKIIRKEKKRKEEQEIIG